MTDDELIARLRSMHWCVTTEANGVGRSDDKVASAAADRIEALAERANELLDRLTLADDKIEELHKRLTLADDKNEELMDRIEALVRGQNYWIDRCGRERAFASSHRVRAERLEALLREARIDLEDYVTQEYPKHAHPYFGRQWDRDMELCRRIDAALKGEGK